MIFQFEETNDYLPLSRDLVYHQHITSATDILQSLTGEITPENNLEKLSLKTFIIEKQPITRSELKNLEIFYHTHYLKPFRFRDALNHVTVDTKTQQPADGIRTIFQCDLDQLGKRYFSTHAIVKVNGQIVSAVSVNQNLEIIFASAPASDVTITIELEYDFLVLFDPSIGIQATAHSQKGDSLISFHLMVIPT